MTSTKEITRETFAIFLMPLKFWAQYIVLLAVWPLLILAEVFDAQAAEAICERVWPWTKGLRVFAEMASAKDMISATCILLLLPLKFWAQYIVLLAVWPIIVLTEGLGIKIQSVQVILNRAGPWVDDLFVFFMSA